MEWSGPPVHFWAKETSSCALSQAHTFDTFTHTHTHTHTHTYSASICKALLCWVKGEGHAAVNTHLSLAEGAVCIPP